MTSTTHDPADTDCPGSPSRGGWRPFIRHFLEMVVTMAVGMVALHPLWQLALRGLGAPHVLTNHPTLMALVMATDMSLGMGAWMRYRGGHSRRSIAEMSATMYVPFALFLPLVWTCVMDGGTMLAAGHILMLPCMLGLMLWRRDEYSHAHHPAARRSVR